METVELDVEVFVHQLVVEVFVELLRGAELADGETDGVLLSVA